MCYSVKLQQRVYNLNDLCTFENFRRDLSNNTSSYFFAFIVPDLKFTMNERTDKLDQWSLDLVSSRAFEQLFNHLRRYSRYWRTDRQAGLIYEALNSSRRKIRNDNQTILIATRSMQLWIRFVKTFRTTSQLLSYHNIFWAEICRRTDELMNRQTEMIYSALTLSRWDLPSYSSINSN